MDSDSTKMKLAEAKKETRNFPIMCSVSFLISIAVLIVLLLKYPLSKGGWVILDIMLMFPVILFVVFIVVSIIAEKVTRIWKNPKKVKITISIIDIAFLTVGILGVASGYGFFGGMLNLLQLIGNIMYIILSIAFIIGLLLAMFF